MFFASLVALGCISFGVGGLAGISTVYCIQQFSGLSVPM